jgi:hypothetical protein
MHRGGFFHRDMKVRRIISIKIYNNLSLKILCVMGLSWSKLRILDWLEKSDHDLLIRITFQLGGIELRKVCINSVICYHAKID